MHSDAEVAQELSRGRRNGNTLSMLIIDIDYFKRYNDHYGHLAGDACLQLVADRLSACLRRQSDFLARCGGEEMVAI